MDKINNIEELSLLAPKEKFYRIKDGHCNPYMFACINPAYEKSVVAIPKHSHLDAVVFSKSNFTPHSVFLKGPYSSTEVGQVMIAQHNDHIAAIVDIFFKAINIDRNG